MSETCSSSHFFAGEIIGRCVLQKLLQVRKNSEVWRVFDRQRKVPAILKLLAKEHRHAEFFPALADYLLFSDCPQLVRMYDFLEAGGYYGAELEYADGGTAGSKLRKTGRFSLAQTVFLMREVLLALAELHRNGIIHRDVKPGNILLTSSGAVKLGDLSIARVRSLPEKGPMIFGTPSTMSPEQTFDSTQVDERSDFFSLSSAVYEFLTGHPRFPRGEFVATLKIIRESRPDRFQEELQEYATGDFITLLEQMAANRPEERPGSASDILRELERLHLPCSPLIQSKPAKEETEPQSGLIGQA